MSEILMSDFRKIQLLYYPFIIVFLQPEKKEKHYYDYSFRHYVAVWKEGVV